MSQPRWQECAALVLEVAWLSVMIIYDIIKQLIASLVPPVLKDIRGKTVLVTGAASGLGRALSLRLACHGCRLLLVDINQQQNSQVAEEARAAGSPHVSCFTCDVSDRDAVMRLAQEAPHVDILINNAGIVSSRCSPGDKQSEQIRRLFEINIVSHFWMAQAFLPGMLLRDRGHIVAIASIAGLVSAPIEIAYVSSKHAVVGFMGSLRQLLRYKGRNNIKTTVVCPYFLETPHIVNNFKMRQAPLPMEQVAHAIVDGIQKEKTMIILPKLHAFLHSFKYLYPENAVDRVQDFFWFNMKDPPHELADEAAFVKR